MACAQVTPLIKMTSHTAESLGHTIGSDTRTFQISKTFKRTRKNIKSSVK
jgi:hypothetical protein